MTSRSMAVLLDIDGTLIDSTYHHALAWHRAFARVGDTPPMWRLHRAIGMGGDKLVAAVAGDEVEHRHGDELRGAWREEYSRTRAEVLPLPGAAALVGHLSQIGMRIGLASSGDPEFAREAVDLLGIDDQIELLTTSQDAADSKPEPDLIEVTIKRMGGVEAAVFVGDTAYDVEAAQRAGLGCVAVRTGGVGGHELRDAGALLVAESLEELVSADWTAYLSPL